MRIIDTHCHLNDEKLFSQVSTVIQRAKKNGVVAVYNATDCLASFSRVLLLQKQYPEFCHAVLGIHPEFALETPETFVEAYETIESHRNDIAAIGEIGLDYHTNKEPDYIKASKARFIEQIRLAKRLSLPIVIHSRDADEDTLDIIRQELPPKMDLHCYSGSYETLKSYLSLPIEVHIGIGGVVTFTNGRVLKEVVSKSDVSLFLSETDAPYLAPVPYRGRMNEPCYLPEIITEIATLKHTPLETIAEQLYQNGVHFYGTR
jgi:TatD DNase family protein